MGAIVIGKLIDKPLLDKTVVVVERDVYYKDGRGDVKVKKATQQ